MGAGGTGGHVGAFADAEGRNQGGITANKGAVFDDGDVLIYAIVIAGNRARSYIYPITDLGVTQVGEMVGLGAPAQPCLLGLNKVADVRSFPDLAAGAQM